MGMTAFDEVPQGLFFSRMGLPCFFLGVFFFFGVGVVANSLEFQQVGVPSEVAPFWSSAFRHYSRVISSVTQGPEFCWSGQTVNEFQERQCSQYWEGLVKSGSLAFIPFIFIALFLYFALGFFSDLYRGIQKKIKKGKASFAAIVTNPPEGKPDIFSWFYCLRPIVVQLPNQVQIKAYIPYEASIPTPGQTMAVFEMSSWLGEKRYLALTYDPHIVIVKGS